MAIQDKYSEVIELINKTGGRDVTVSEDGGVLKLNATVPTPNEKNAVWNKIKEIGGENPADIIADIKMDSAEVPEVASAGAKTYTVKSGDTLSKIAKDLYGDAGKYMDIYNANTDKLSDPNKIDVGQELIIP